MATTTNYSWVTPDDTDLVKDGASAIRTLGSSIDTTTKNLNPSTTLGDVEYRSSTANTNTRLGIGATGEVLTVAGGVPTWAAIPAGGGMTLISTTTLTGASIVLSSIPQTYNSLIIYIRNFSPATSTNALAVRVNGSSAARYANGGATGGSNNTFPDTRWDITSSPNSSAGQAFTKLELPDYANTATWKVALAQSFQNNQTTNTNINFTQFLCAYNQTGAITSLTFLAQSGNLSAGTVLLYGVK